MSFTRVCTTAELPGTKQVKGFTVEGTKVALVRDADGGLHAVEDDCSHANVKLSDGRVVGDRIGCWLHGATFDLATGEPKAPPATTGIQVYAVRIDGEDVLVDVTTPTNSTDSTTASTDSTTASSASSGCGGSCT